MFIGSKLIPQQSNFWRLSAGAALIASALAGCGGGGGGGGGTPATLSGAVIDGYISGATVCLDLNANQACDSGEPTAQSGENGAYSLDITGISMDALKAAHLFTVVPDTAKDSDDTGTLEQAGKAPFSLLAPVAAYVSADNTVGKAVISPLTTLVSHDMIVNEKPLAGAQNAVRYTLGLGDKVDLSQDFVGTKDKALHQQAQVIAAALGQAQAAISTSNPKPSSRDAFFAALTYVQENAKDLNPTSLASNTVAAHVSEKMKGSFSPDTNKLLNEARKSTQSVAAGSVTDLLKDGGYLTDLLQDPQPQYTQALVKDGKLSVTGFAVSGDQWKALQEDGDREYALTADGWKEHNGCAGATIVDNGPGKASLNCGNSTATMSVRTQNIESKSLANLGQTVPTGFENFTFPENSKIFLSVITNSTDEYQITGGQPVTGPDNQSLSNISNFMTAYATTISSSTGVRFYPDGESPFSFTFDKPSEKSGTVSLWQACTTAGTADCPTKLGEATYEIKTVHNQDVLIVRVKPTEEAPGNYLLFGVKGGYLYSGVYRPAFTGSVTDFFLNKTAMDAVLTTAKLPTLPKSN